VDLKTNRRCLPNCNDHLIVSNKLFSRNSVQQASDKYLRKIVYGSILPSVVDEIRSLVHTQRPGICCLTLMLIVLLADIDEKSALPNKLDYCRQLLTLNYVQQKMMQQSLLPKQILGNVFQTCGKLTSQTLEKEKLLSVLVVSCSRGAVNKDIF